jgi:hypothetical protein
MSDPVYKYKKPRKQKQFTPEQRKVMNSYHKKGVTAEELTAILGLPLDEKTIQRVRSKSQLMGVSLGKVIKK